MNASREERRQAARAKAEQLRQEQAARERRSRNILIGVLVGIVALVVVVGVLIFNESKKTLLDEFDGAVPANTDNRGGIVVGATGTAGEKTSGADNLEVYLDFMCPYCGQFELANAADLEELRAAGELNVTYHVMSNLDGYSTTAFSTRSANAAATVASLSPEHFVAFVEGMFVNQPEEGGAGLSDEQIAAIAVEAGVPQEVADTFVEGTYNEWVAVATQQSRREGVTGTPTVFLNGDKVEGVGYYTEGQLGAWLETQGVVKVGE